MGGERRRRRLRRGGRGPAGEPSTGASPDGAAALDDEPAAGGADPDLESPPPDLESAPPDPESAPLDPKSAPPGLEAAPAPHTVGRTMDNTRRSASPHSGGPRPPAAGTQHRPSPADLAELAGSFALTAAVHDPEPAGDQPVQPVQPAQHGEDPTNERGLRGLVGGGSSQVKVTAAMRARDASRPSDENLAAAEADLPIVRRGWVPRDELPRPGAH